MRRLGLALLAACWLASSTAAAQTSDESRAAARQLGKEALAHYNDGQLEQALDKFQRAHALVGLSTTGLYTARTLEKLGRLVEASELYLEVSRMSLPADAKPQHVDAQAEATKAYQAVLPRIPKLTINLTNVPAGAEPTVTLDGAQVPGALIGVARIANPGTHQVSATANGQSLETTVDLPEATTREVTLDFSQATAAPVVAPPVPPGPTGPMGPQPPMPPDTGGDDGGSVQATLGWVTLGVGAAGLLVGAITGGLAVGKKGDLEDNCPGGACSEEFHSDVDSFQTLRIASGVSLIAGGVLAAGGLVLVLTAPDDGRAVALAPSPGGLLFTGRF